MDPVDLKETCSTPPLRPLLALRVCLSSGRSQWPTKCHPCTQAATWTITGTGIPHTTRILCPDLRWCDWKRKNRARETLFHIDTYLTSDGAFLYNVHHVFYCLVCLKGLCFTLYASRLHVLHFSSFLTFSDLLQCAWNKEFMKEWMWCYSNEWFTEIFSILIGCLNFDVTITIGNVEVITFVLIGYLKQVWYQNIVCDSLFKTI